MIVMLHVIIALTSLILTTVTYVAPSLVKLRIVYGFAAATAASGFYLVASEPAHMMQSCLMGIAYVALVSLGIIVARRKLAASRTIS